MKPVITVFMCFAIVGIFDDLLDLHLGTGETFSRALKSMGSMALSAMGLYCIGITFIQGHAQAIAALGARLPFDPSLLVTCILAPDTGGLPIALEMAETPALGIYTGALVTAGLGATLGYQIPVLLSMLDKSFRSVLMRGFVYGLIALPLGLAAGGALLGLAPMEWLINTIPVLVLCAVLIVALLAVPTPAIKVLSAFGAGLEVFTYILTSLTIIGVFLPQFAIADTELVEEFMFLTLRTCIVVCGGQVAANLVVSHFGRPIAAAARLLKTRPESVVGLLLSSIHSFAMLPLFPQMDRKGKLMNAAFCVCGSYMFGGQSAFVAQLIPASGMPAFMINKAVCGLGAVALVLLFERRQEDEPPQSLAAD